jgi:hypothetical protein
VSVSLLRDDPWVGPPADPQIVIAATVGPKTVQLTLDAVQARQLSALLIISGADRALAMAVLDAADLLDAP